MEKIDLKKDYKKFYTAKEKPELITISSGQFLTIVGRGEPGGKVYSNSLNALYSLAYTLKFKIKKEQAKDYTVMGLEGLWWWDKPKTFSMKDAPPRQEWNWKSMIRQPDFVTTNILEEIRSEVYKKKGLEEVNLVQLEVFDEGLSAQILHVGPYSDEERSIVLLNDFIKEQGYQHRGHHHEIYLNDPNRTAPEKVKTIIRHPIEKL
ncbi:hypothetical protein FJY84_02070 [Candidatus Bathyarchaeota archaeon]|nr:hypothetical protein [Candidatus Bathyarchaeota archaeon]